MTAPTSVSLLDRVRPLRTRRQIQLLHARRIRRLEPALVSAIEPVMQTAKLRIRSVRVTETGVAVAILSAADRVPRAVAKVALDKRAEERLRAEVLVLRQLAADAKLVRLLTLLPVTEIVTRVDGRYIAVQRALPGTPGNRLDARSRERALLHAADSIGELHRASVRSDATNPPAAWIRDPLEDFARFGGSEVERILPNVRAAATGAEQVIWAHTREPAWAHGDFWLGNVLLTRDGSRVTGILDWEQARKDRVPAIDVLHLVLYERALRQRRQFGAVIASALERPSWTPIERRALERSNPALLVEDAFCRAALIVCWLAHAASNLKQSPAYHANTRWMRGNVLDVAAAVARG